MAEVKVSKEALASFRQSLEDMLLVLKELAPLCESFTEMADIVELSLANDAQAKLLMHKVVPQGKK